MKHLKSLMMAVMMIVMAISVAACGTTGNTTPDTGNNESIAIGSADSGTTSSVNENQTTGSVNTSVGGNTSASGNTSDSSNTDEDKTDILVVYFSCTNTTKGRAETLQARLSADIYEITPAVPYNAADLNYNSDCRANREQNDPTARPVISGSVENIEQYNVVYIGYPIWWGQAPKIIYTFLESYNFDGITIIPFCTSGSSDIGTSGTNLRSSAPNAIWKEGCRVGSAADIDTLVSMR